MPKQDSIIKIVGTIDDITFYRHHGKHFCKKKRAQPQDFHTNSSFTVFRMRNKFFTKSAKLAGCIYTIFPDSMRNYKCWSRLLKWVFRSVMEETSVADIFARSLKNFNLINYHTPDPEVNQLLEKIYKRAISRNLLLISEEDIPYIHNPLHLAKPGSTSQTSPARTE